MKKIKTVCREKYINGVFSVLYGFDWDTEEVIYRQVVEGKVVYIKEPITHIEDVSRRAAAKPPRKEKKR